MTSERPVRHRCWWCGKLGAKRRSVDADNHVHYVHHEPCWTKFFEMLTRPAR